MLNVKQNENIFEYDKQINISDSVIEKYVQELVLYDNAGGLKNHQKQSSNYLYRNILNNKKHEIYHR